MSEFGYYILWMYLWVDDMPTLGVCYISAVMFYCWNFYACQLRIIWRCDVYFLNIYYIRVIYRFNRSGTLHFPLFILGSYIWNDTTSHKSAKVNIFFILVDIWNGKAIINSHTSGGVGIRTPVMAFDLTISTFS